MRDDDDDGCDSFHYVHFEIRERWFVWGLGLFLIRGLGFRILGVWGGGWVCCCVHVCGFVVWRLLKIRIEVEESKYNLHTDQNYDSNLGVAAVLLCNIRPQSFYKLLAVV